MASHATSNSPDAIYKHNDHVDAQYLNASPLHTTTSATQTLGLDHKSDLVTRPNPLAYIRRDDGLFVSVIAADELPLSIQESLGPLIRPEIPDNFKLADVFTNGERGALWTYSADPTKEVQFTDLQPKTPGIEPKPQTEKFQGFDLKQAFEDTLGVEEGTQNLFNQKMEDKLEFDVPETQQLSKMEISMEVDPKVDHVDSDSMKREYYHVTYQ